MGRNQSPGCWLIILIQNLKKFIIQKKKKVYVKFMLNIHNHDWKVLILFPLIDLLVNFLVYFLYFLPLQLGVKVV